MIEAPNIQTKRHPTVAIPSDIINNTEFSGELRGIYINNTQWYNILPNGEGKVVGEIISSNTNQLSKYEVEIISAIKSIELSQDSINGNKLRRSRNVTHELSEDTVDYILKTVSEWNGGINENLNNAKTINAGIWGYFDNSSLKLYELEIDESKLRIYQARLEPYSLKLDLFSRNTGILESDIMLKKKVLFIGCGSVGSLVAVELAKAGVGHFMLVDNDVFGYHNICRHQCGIYDVGRYKTDAVADRILAINPFAEVIKFNLPIEDVDRDAVLNFCNADTVIVGGADNREGDLYACNLGLKAGASFVSIGCWERAFAGEVFYCLPEGTPTYADFLAVTGYVSGRVTQNRRFYTTEADLEKVSFEPGISADVNFVTIVGVKLILDLLNRDNEGYTQRVLPHLTQYTLICNTNDPKIGGEQAEIFSYPLQVTTSIIVPYADDNQNQE